MSPRVVLFGGTFDPVTSAHVVVADQAQRLLQPDEFWFVVANVPGQRKSVFAPAEKRLEMVRAAVADDGRFTVIDNEIRRGGVTSTADTMAELRCLHPGHRFELLLGADSARTISAWRFSSRLLRDETFDIVNRTGEQPLTMDEALALGYDRERTAILEIASPPLSASEARRRVEQGQSLEGVVPGAAAAIIRRDGLYAARPSPA